MNCERKSNFCCFVHNFRNLCLNLDKFLVKYEKNFGEGLICFMFKNKTDLKNSLNKLSWKNFQRTF